MLYVWMDGRLYGRLLVYYPCRLDKKRFAPDEYIFMKLSLKMFQFLIIEQ